MRTALLSIIFTLLFGFGYTQEDQDTSDVQIIPYPQREAQFPGGSTSLKKYLIKNLIYPEGYANTDKVGTIFVSFFINTDGSISQIKIEKGKDEKLDEMVKKVIMNMPDWKPAENDGRAVRSRMVLPVNIRIE